MIKKIILTREANKNKPWNEYFSQYGFTVESIPLLKTIRNILFLI